MGKLSKPLFFASAAAGGFATGAAIAGSVAAVGLGYAAWRLLQPRTLPPGSVILVTGGSRGLGLAIASRFAHDQVRLVLCARNYAELEHAQYTLLGQHPHLHPEDFYLVAADLSQRHECERLIAEAIAHFGRIDVLVNNAGIIEVGPIEAQPVEAFRRAMELNFFAALHTTWAALPHLRTQPALAGTRRAAIVNIASLGGKLAVPHMLPYSSAKFALVGFSEGLHAELRAKGIRVTTVCPGLMRTGGEAHAQFVGDQAAEARWFNLAATTPVLSVSADYAANRIYRAVRCGRTEIAISPQAWLAARFAGLCPETTQCLNALTNQHILPTAPDESQG